MEILDYSIIRRFVYSIFRLLYDYIIPEEELDATDVGGETFGHRAPLLHIHRSLAAPPSESLVCWVIMFYL